MCEIVEEVSPIVPYVYLGSHKGLTRAGLLEEYSIRDVISVVSKKEWEALQKRFCVTINTSTFYDKHDDLSEDMLTLFPIVCDQIARAVTEKRPVFVHCMQGISRSSTLVTAYLMASRQWPAENALAFLKTRRANIDPNINFREQLVLWEHLKWRLDMDKAKLRNYLVNMIAMSARDFPEKLVSHMSEYRKIVRRLETEWGKSASVDYFCKKCFGTLFHKRNILKPDEEVESRTNDDQCITCEFYLIEPVYWLKKKVFKVDQETILNCPGCSTPVGTCRVANSPFELCTCSEHQTLPQMKIKLTIDKSKSYHKSPN